MSRVFTTLVIMGLVLVLGVANYNIGQKQQVVENGQQVLLKLGELLVFDTLVSKDTEAGVDAVMRASIGEGAQDNFPAAIERIMV